VAGDEAVHQHFRKHAEPDLDDHPIERTQQRARHQQMIDDPDAGTADREGELKPVALAFGKRHPHFAQRFDDECGRIRRRPAEPQRQPMPSAGSRTRCPSAGPPSASA
jgi:hypothetical protein